MRRYHNALRCAAMMSFATAVEYRHHRHAIMLLMLAALRMPPLRMPRYRRYDID